MTAFLHEVLGAVLILGCGILAVKMLGLACFMWQRWDEIQWRFRQETPPPKLYVKDGKWMTKP